MNQPFTFFNTNSKIAFCIVGYEFALPRPQTDVDWLQCKFDMTKGSWNSTFGFTVLVEEVGNLQRDFIKFRKGEVETVNFQPIEPELNFSITRVDELTAEILVQANIVHKTKSSLRTKSEMKFEFQCNQIWDAIDRLIISLNSYPSRQFRAI